MARKEMVIEVWGSNTSKGTYFNTVKVGSANLIAPWGASGNSYQDVEIEEVSGGYDKGDSRHAWEATYTLKVRCPVDAQPRKVGRQLNGSSGFRVVSEKVLA